jgi:uncharacterized protein (AIM24 family)
MADASTSYTCRWCRSTSDGASRTCPSCGAPTDIREVATDSGWTKLPPIPDMTRIQFGQSTCQIEGSYVPAADMKLAAGDSVYFSHHVLLWQDTATQLATLPMKGAWNRTLAGMPLVMMEATGPGHIAFSRDAPGEVIAIPIQPGTAVDVREHHFLVASSPVTYDWLDTGVWFTTTGEKKSSGRGGTAMKVLKVGFELASILDSEGDVEVGRDGGETEWHYPLGKFIDRFSCAGPTPGLMLVHAGGNVFVRTLAEGETIMVKPPALLFKDPTVGMQLHVEYPQAGMKFWRSWGNRYLWLRMWGPGRVAVQSAYEKMEDPGSNFQSISQHTEYRW